MNAPQARSNARRFLSGTTIQLVTRPGYTKALLNNRLGWKSVWLPDGDGDYGKLRERIALAMKGGQ